jgi:hypothetical protein
VVQGAWGESLTILSCYLSGWVGWGQVYGPGLLPSIGRLVMIGSYIQDGSEQFPPPPFRAQPDATNLPFTVLGCGWRAAGKSDGRPDGLFADQIGVVQNGSIVPTWQVTPNGTVGLFGSPPLAQPTVTGSWADGSAGKSLAQALASLGLIVDQTVSS